MEEQKKSIETQVAEWSATDADILARFGKDREILESAFRAVAARWVA